MGSLYEITQRGLNLLDVLKSGDVEPEVLDAALATVNTDLQEKAGDYIAVMSEMNGHLDLVKAEIKRLTDYKKSLESNQERMKQALNYAMHSLGKESISTGRGTIKLKWNPESTVIDDATALPTEFTRTEIKIVPDKTAIKNAIKAGQDVPGAHLERVQRVEVK